MVKIVSGSKARAATGSPRAARAHALPAVRPGYYRGDQYHLQESVGFLMKQVTESLSRAIELRMAAYGLTDAQWRPLFLLSRNDTSTATQIARSIGCDAGAMTRLMDRLEDKGLLRRVRSADDRRVQQLELTEEGRKAATVVPYVIADVLNAHLVDLSHGEIDQLRTLLERVLAAGQRGSDYASAPEQP